MLFPFRKERTQRAWSVFFIVLGVLIMIVGPLSRFIQNLGLNAFVIGLILAFVGFFYFMDVQ